jgi:Zn-dependent protease
MNTKIELGRIAGIPIILDMFFVLVLILFATPFFTSGNMQAMSIGVVVIAGLLVSILLHELGHAFAGRAFKVGVTQIELTGLGGVAQFDRSLPKSTLIRTIIYLAGPFANLLLWIGLDWVSVSPLAAGSPAFGFAMQLLSGANFALLVFNLLPAFPLDGGRTLEAWITPLAGSIWATRIVGSLGVLAAIGVAVYAFPASIWLMLLAVVLFIDNWQALRSVGWPPGMK